MTARARTATRGAAARALGAGVVVVMVLAAAAGPAPGDDDETPVVFTDAEKRLIARHSPLPPVPADPTNRVADDDAAAHLGRFLFFDPRLSGPGTVSCETCHDQANGLSNGLPLGVGVGPTRRNAQGLWNVGHNRWFYWDGSADTLWAQALRPIEAANEMGGDRDAVARLVVEDPELRAAYEAVFGALPGLDEPSAVDGVFANVGKAIAAYERRLVTGPAPFDVFAEGLRDGDPAKLAALTPSAQRGLRLFVGAGNCRTCHTGPNFTDGEFHSIGVPPADGGLPRDAGRYDGARRVRGDPFNAAGTHSDDPDGAKAAAIRQLVVSPESWGQFKTPSLRNVALTPPYMQEG
ncbi:MAG: cytochrome-c peroxidase, partial [Planctomycetota bacterium]